MDTECIDFDGVGGAFAAVFHDESELVPYVGGDRSATEVVAAGPDGDRCGIRSGAYGCDVHDGCKNGDE